MRGIIIGVHGQIDFDPLKPRHHARQRAHMLAEARDRAARGDGAISPAGHEQFVAGTEFNRLGHAARVQQFLAPAGRTLRTRRHVVLGDGGAQQVEADNVIAQFGAKTGGDCFCDLERGKLDCGLSDAVARERR